MIDSTGAVRKHWAYDSFGNVTATSGDPTLTFDHLYTGREYDAITGLYFYRARWYDPAVARFISRDPLGLSAGDPNTSGYVFNSPMMNTDPSGMIAPAVVGYALVAGVTALVGTGIEAGVAYGIGDTNFSFWGSFARNFTVDVFTNLIPGKIAGSMLYRTARVAAWKAGIGTTGRSLLSGGMKYGPLGVARTAVETAWLTQVEGRDFGGALLQTGLGNAVGLAGLPLASKLFSSLMRNTGASATLDLLSQPIEYFIEHQRSFSFRGLEEITFSQ